MSGSPAHRGVYAGAAGLTLFWTFPVCWGGVAKYAATGLSFGLYISRCFASFDWSNFYAPTIKTAVFGFVIATVSCFPGYTTNEGPQGAGRAATRSVVASSLLIIVLESRDIASNTDQHVAIL